MIESLLAEREDTGRSLASLAAGSGIPAGTLAWWAHRRRHTRGGPATSFVELVVADQEPSTERGAAEAALELSVIVQSGARRREIVVPRGFDPEDLRALIAALEDAC